MSRRLGQHFLHDPSILDRIVRALDPGPGDLVLEIGAGPGTLTRRLAPRVGRVVALEKDFRLVEALLRSDLPENVTVLAGDALEVPWGESFGRAAAFKVIGNIPYRITTPLIGRLLSEPGASLGVLLVQLEVARRLGASPGTREYGALSVGVQTAARVETLFRVRPGSFRPPPRVDSCLVRITPRPEPPLDPAEMRAFREVVTAIFSARRKQLTGALRKGLGMTTLDQARAAIGRAGLDPGVRPEVLSPHEFVRLFRSLSR